MGFCKKIIAGTIQSLQIPIAVIKDVATMGGVLTGEKQTYTRTKLEDLGETVEEIIEDLKK